MPVLKGNEVTMSQVATHLLYLLRVGNLRRVMGPVVWGVSVCGGHDLDPLR